MVTLCPFAPLPLCPVGATGISYNQAHFIPSHAWVTYLLSFIIHVLLIPSHDYAFSLYAKQGCARTNARVYAKEKIKASHTPF